MGSTCRRVANQALLFGSGALSETECQVFFSVFDLTSLDWTNSYDPNAAAYLVPSAVASVIGGNLTGGAKTLAPKQLAGPWTDSLEELFSKTPWGPANISSKFGIMMRRAREPTRRAPLVIHRQPLLAQVRQQAYNLLGMDLLTYPAPRSLVLLWLELWQP